MKLDILVPQYREDKTVIKPLLDSIATQQNIDFDDISVIICNDGSDILLDEVFLTSYPFKIKYIKSEHRGVSATRNTALDASKADYVMFCDADDMFYHNVALWFLFREMELGFDTLMSAFYEEGRHPQTKEPLYIIHQTDSTFVHGKVHRRKFLKDNNIRFNPDLTIHEDSYFNILCQQIAQKDRAKYCQMPFYIWKWRDDSVCRHDPKYILKTYRNMLDSNDALIEEFLKRNLKDKAKEFVSMMVYDTYYLFNKPEWKEQENQEYRQLTEERFKAYYAKYNDLWLNTPNEVKMVISNGIRQRSIQEGMEMENITLSDWLNLF
jgi:glycosyltransferase involved in cell wall biosynthesis